MRTRWRAINSLRALSSFGCCRRGDVVAHNVAAAHAGDRRIFSLFYLCVVRRPRGVVDVRCWRQRDRGDGGVS